MAKENCLFLTILDKKLFYDSPHPTAFTSLPRAYATYPAEMKSVLNVRALHLGHYAKSLCLRETPSALGRWRAEGGDGGRARRYVGSDGRFGRKMLVDGQGELCVVGIVPRESYVEECCILRSGMIGAIAGVLSLLVT